jgi:WD40 repeat protein
MLFVCPNCSSSFETAPTNRASATCPFCDTEFLITSAQATRWWRFLAVVPILLVCVSVVAVVRQMVGASVRTSPELVRTFPASGDAIRSLAFHPDSNRLVAAAGVHNSELTVWDSRTWQKVTSVNVGQDLYSVAFSPDGQRLVTNGANSQVVLRDAATGQVISAFKGHGGFVWSVAFSTDNQHVASGADDQTVRLWNATTGRALILRGHTGMVDSVAFSPDHRLLASASEDRTVRLWNASDGRLVSSLPDHQAAVNRVAFSPDGLHLASACGSSLRVWETATGRLTLTLDAGYGAIIDDIAYSPDGKRLAAACNPNRRDRPPGLVIVWDAAAGTEIASLRGHTSWALSVVFLGDADRLASGAFDGSINLWDLSRAPLKK